MSSNNKSGLNVNASVFTPSANAAAFVPGRQSHPVPPPPPATTTETAYGAPRFMGIAPPPGMMVGGEMPAGVFVNGMPPANAQLPYSVIASSTMDCGVASSADVPSTTPHTSAAGDTSDSATNGEMAEQMSDLRLDEDALCSKTNQMDTATARSEQMDTWDDKADEEEEDEEDEDESSSATEASQSMQAVKKKKNTTNGAASSEPKKEFINVVFIGHVDAGKSTISGQILFLTGMVDKRTLEKYEREAKEKNRETWYLSWALDTNAEEREKGKTVEVGRAFFETERKHFTILDAPGHKSFVPNMIGGASQADLAVLVISARKGEFETGFERGGQTREHAMLVKTAGVKQLVILVNKMDDVTVQWDQDRYLEIQEKLNPFLRKVGFNPKTDLQYIPCSGMTGLYIKDRQASPICEEAAWYQGPGFIEYVDSLPPISRLLDAPPRVVIVDKYSDMGTIALGKVEAGIITKGHNLIMKPNGEMTQVIQLFSDDQEVEEVTPGENVKLKLKNIEEDAILPGFVLCSPGENEVKVGRIFDAQVNILEHKSIICPGYSCILHIHAAVEEVKVTHLICLIDRKTGEKDKGKRPRFVKEDQMCIMRLESPEPFCLETFKDFPQMGRFTLRDEGKTIAIGKVLKVIE